MKVKKLKICDAIIHAGETASLALPLPELYACSPLYMPIKVAHGKNEGPCLLIVAAMKENELNGVEIINRLMDNQAMIDSLNGTLIVVPVLNVFHLTSLAKALPVEFDISRAFPGSQHGTFAERIAHVFTQEVLTKADYCIELKTGGLNHDILPQVFCNTDDDQLLSLAKVFQAPVVTHVLTRNYSLRQAASSLNIPLLVYEAGEASRFDENAIALGVKGIRNLMCHTKMLNESDSEQSGNVVISEESEWLRAPKSGILHTDVELGNVVQTNDVMGRIRDPFGSQDDEVLKAVFDGVVVGINRNPLLYEGQSTFKIASFIDNRRAEKTIGNWEDEHIS